MASRVFEVGRCLLGCLLAVTVSGCSTRWPAFSFGGSSVHDDPPGIPSSGVSGGSASGDSTPAGLSVGGAVGAQPASALSAQLDFQVTRVEFPLDGGRCSRKIWNHVDMVRAGPSAVRRLARNGLRVGVASRDSLPAIETIIEACGGTSGTMSLVSQIGLPVSLAMADISSRETVFYYEEGRGLIGKTFENGQKLITLEGRLQPESPRASEIGLSFEVRHDPGSFKWDRSGGDIRPVPVIERHVFESVAASLMLGADEFLVIGPGVEAENEYLLGSRFLDVGRPEGRRETVVLVSARMSASDRGP